MNTTVSPTQSVVAELRAAWPVLSSRERLDAWLKLPRRDGEDVFLGLTPQDQASLVHAVSSDERRAWLRLLAPDDAADLIQAATEEERGPWLDLLDDRTRVEVRALLAYAEDDAGGRMNPRYARVRAEMTADEAIEYFRKQSRESLDEFHYLYVLDEEQRLLGVLSVGDLFRAEAGRRVSELMRPKPVTVLEGLDQEEVVRLFLKHAIDAVPVVDAESRMKGIVTADDVVEVAEEEATEDAQKFGGMEALRRPYLEVAFWGLVRRRIGWLAVLFVGELLTATAMAHFENAISRAVVLALFVPLIVSSGGNSGSQASTLVIRAMAVGDVRLDDWWRVARREVAAGLTLGAILGAVGLARVLLWEACFGAYGAHALAIALTVAASVVGVVLFGTVAGSMLPFLLRRAGLDPASASAPFVATLVDVTGLVIYFTTAGVILRGSLL